jgi:outer membrane protein assembly factor BamB
MGSPGASDGSFASSPLLEGEMLIVEVGGDAKKPGPVNPFNTAYVAFDRKTGTVRWAAENDGAAFSAPVAIDAAGARQVVFFSATGLVSVSPKDGKVFWRYPWKTQFDVNAATPLLLPGDRLFVSSGYDVGAAVLQLKPEAGGGVKVEEVWKSRVMKNHFASSIHLLGHLYGFDKSTFKCVDAGTGAEKWAGRGYGTGNVIYADGHLIVLTDRGELALLEATPEQFRELAKVQVLEGRTITSPALADGKLYLRNNTDEIVCVDLSERKEKS